MSLSLIFKSDTFILTKTHSNLFVISLGPRFLSHLPSYSQGVHHRSLALRPGYSRSNWDIRIIVNYPLSPVDYVRCKCGLRRGQGGCSHPVVGNYGGFRRAEFSVRMAKMEYEFQMTFIHAGQEGGNRNSKVKNLNFKKKQVLVI